MASYYYCIFQVACCFMTTVNCLGIGINVFTYYCTNANLTVTKYLLVSVVHYTVLIHDDSIDLSSPRRYHVELWLTTALDDARLQCPSPINVQIYDCRDHQPTKSFVQFWVRTRQTKLMPGYLHHFSRVTRL